MFLQSFGSVLAFLLPSRIGLPAGLLSSDRSAFHGGCLLMHLASAGTSAQPTIDFPTRTAANIDTKCRFRRSGVPARIRCASRASSLPWSLRLPTMLACSASVFFRAFHTPTSVGRRTLSGNPLAVRILRPVVDTSREVSSSARASQTNQNRMSPPKEPHHT